MDHLQGHESKLALLHLAAAPRCWLHNFSFTSLDVTSKLKTFLQCTQETLDIIVQEKHIFSAGSNSGTQKKKKKTQPSSLLLPCPWTVSGGMDKWTVQADDPHSYKWHSYCFQYNPPSFRTICSIWWKNKQIYCYDQSLGETLVQQVCETLLFLFPKHHQQQAF